MVSSMDELQERVRRQMYRFQDLADQMKAVRGRETSEDGAVTAEVDGNGALKDLQFSSAVSRMTPEEFERIVVRTAAAAARQAFERRAAVVRQFNEEMAG
ncbi:YbaB/EbfC family nucleoid-associated protein [Nocardia sp. 2]|uniref:YbaB/EbfC family nucleoid-associated protein n=1 Tax=Nocardia acididurans TaxID=2802282 RepID=A0ABS1M546_9NOCA|nr:YbaB/EbfC family nucleoid-associated protein [Nocardia acididurans]MBL1075180.1 YbaB/EbfC family nucleoid-associated protein [Nocardia acididurans]